MSKISDERKAEHTKKDEEIGHLNSLVLEKQEEIADLRQRLEDAEREKTRWEKVAEKAWGTLDSEMQRELSSSLRIVDRIRTLEAALRFYANERHYEYDETGVLRDYRKRGKRNEADYDGVIEDGGAIAREALSAPHSEAETNDPPAQDEIRALPNELKQHMEACCRTNKDGKAQAFGVAIEIVQRAIRESEGGE